MVWKRLFGTDSSRGLDQVRATILEMLANDRHSFDLATSALLMGSHADVVGPDLLATDRQVNEATAEVRRQLVVHVGVHGASEAAPVLTFMSIVKDVERVGDYAKNILDLAREGADLSQDDDQEELSAYRNRVSALITEASRIFGEGDAEAARTLSAEGDEMLDDFDRRVDAYVQSDLSARAAVPRALYYRYLKRIVAHLMNLLTALTMPLDRLDYFDEDAAAR
jgi:phosphate transport system protein